VEAFDVVKDVGAGVIEGAVLAPVDPLALEHTEEALGRGVVPTVPTRLILKVMWWPFRNFS
jgi:hypothetical protein